MRKLSFEEIKSARPTPEEIEQEGRFPISVVAENIRSLFNVGSIFRTSDAARIEKLYLTGFSGQPPRNEISKTALGADRSVPWEYRKNTPALIRQLKSEGKTLVVLEHTDASRDFRKVTYTFPVVLVIGNEVEGVTDDVVQLADLAVEIPMFGIKQSLNVAVAYGITVYEILHKYLEKFR